jgi:serine protease Do
LELSDSSDLKQGQLVLAFGSPLGFDNSVSMGIVSSVARQPDPDSPTIYGKRRSQAVLTCCS